MGVAGAAHFIVNVGSEFTTSSAKCQSKLTLVQSRKLAPVLLPTSERITIMCSLVAVLCSWSSSTSISRKSSSMQMQERMLTVHRETKQKTLEEIAAAFGDRVVEIGEQQIAAEGAVFEGKAGSVHIEDEHMV